MAKGGQNGDNRTGEAPISPEAPPDPPRRTNGHSSESFYVDQWLVEPSLNRISRNGTNGIEDHLEPKTMAVLVFLAERQGQVVSREDLFNSVWGLTFVTDNTLTRTISRLRRALEDDWQNPRYLETISKSGYRLIAPVRTADTVDNDNVAEKPAFGPGKWWRASTALAIVTPIAAVSVYMAMFRAPDSTGAGLDPSPLITLVGTQASSTLSPDGTQVVFSWAGESQENRDIYVKSGVGEPTTTDHNRVAGDLPGLVRRRPIHRVHPRRGRAGRNLPGRLDRGRRHPNWRMFAECAVSRLEPVGRCLGLQ